MNGTIQRADLRRTASRTTLEQQLAADRQARRPRGARRLHRPHNMYHAGWAWAGNTPFQWGKQIGAPLRRHPQPDGRLLAEAASRPTATPRAQFHHVNDIAPTILRS
ncbi:MAG: hypothetical protein MZV70_40040 [Desulfobacterales bacterium]|nr:hypothetical protein [Desulfobacterales bacterium]